MAGRESSRAISRGRDGRENAAGMEERTQQGWKRERSRDGRENAAGMEGQE